MLCAFFRDEAGAVTVDWTVVTAAVVGLGLASVAAVRTGTNALGTSISDSLSSAGVASLGRLGLGILQLAQRLDFTNGDVGGWSLNRTSYLEAIGHFLGPVSRTDGTLTFDTAIPDGATEARIEFDMHLFGSWDGAHPVYGGAEGDGVMFTINNTPVSHELFQAVNASDTQRSATLEVDGTTYALTLTRDTAQNDYRGTGYGFDQSWSVQIEASGDPGQMQLMMRNTTNDATDEHFGIANMQVSHN
jgi:hypothetical protein